MGQAQYRITSQLLRSWCKSARSLLWALRSWRRRVLRLWLLVLWCLMLLLERRILAIADRDVGFEGYGDPWESKDAMHGGDPRDEP